MTSAVEAPASAVTSGHTRIQSVQYGTTRLIWVCWLITSLTSTPQGVARPNRHGRSRALASHHADSSARTRGTAHSPTGSAGVSFRISGIAPLCTATATSSRRRAISPIRRHNLACNGSLAAGKSIRPDSAECLWAPQAQGESALHQGHGMGTAGLIPRLSAVVEVVLVPPGGVAVAHCGQPLGP